MNRARLPLFALALLAACSSKEPETTPGDGKPKPVAPEYWSDDCDPLVPEICGYPFPSNYHAAEDPNAITKKKIALKTKGLPQWKGASTIDAAPWSDLDGFSTGMNLMTYLWRATATDLPSPASLAASITTESPTIILNVETGELVPHFAEIDMHPVEDEDRALMLRPVVRLADASRYIVAIRKVKDPEGAVVPASPAFAALRDGGTFDHPSIEARRALYADIFAKLEAKGIGKADLQIAWDFTTASRDQTTKRLIAMRDDALKLVGEDGPEYEITKVEDGVHGVARKIVGKMKVPLYLTKAEPGGRLNLGEDGLPKQNGFAEYPFSVWIPESAKTDPAPLIQNGHGLLGGRDEGEGGYLSRFQNKYNYVGFAVDWAGMAGGDTGKDTIVITDAIVTDPGGFKAAVDRQHQGILNHVLAMRMMKGRFTRDPNVQFDGKSAIDPSKGCYYRGDSQGGIFGATYVAISTDVTRGLLSVPGAPYSLLLDRSVDFKPFQFLLKTSYRREAELPIIVGLIQMLWDRTEPNGYLPYIAKDMLPNTPKHDVLLHVAIGDFQVSPLGAHYMIRTIGGKQMVPGPRPIWGIPEQPYPFTGSALVEFKDKAPEEPLVNLPPEEKGDDPHGIVRSLTAAQKMADHFFRTGEIIATCDGPCDPE